MTDLGFEEARLLQDIKGLYSIVQDKPMHVITDEQMFIFMVTTTAEKLCEQMIKQIKKPQLRSGKRAKRRQKVEKEILRYIKLWKI